MPTKEPRLNIVLDKETRKVLASLAAHRSLTLSHLAANLIGEALEIEEDRYFSAVVDERRKDTRPALAHDEFWKLAKKKPRS
jgi:hypothetical protein